MIRRHFLSAIASFAALTALPAWAETPSSGVLEVRSADRTYRFEIEIADKPEERSRGLMFRESMDADAGMLFIYPNERIASFWMKNTLIPLDMLFISNEGRILQIAPRVQPLTLDTVESTEPVRAVLELNGGRAEELGIMPGDTVILYRKSP